MSSDSSAMNSAQKELAEYARNQGRIGQLAALSAVEDQRRALAGIARFREAEEAWSMKQLYGHESPEDDMHLTVLGDYNANQTQLPQVPKPEIGKLAKLAIAGGLLASGAGIGVAVPLLIDALKPAAVAPAHSTSTTIERDYQIGDVVVEPQQ